MTPGQVETFSKRPGIIRGGQGWGAVDTAQPGPVSEDPGEHGERFDRSGDRSGDQLGEYLTQGPPGPESGPRVGFKGGAAGV